MEFTFWFLRSFFLLVLLGLPILLFLSLVIYLCGRTIIKLEKWDMDVIGTFYYSFITATTIGYGDFTPVKRVSRLIAVFIGFVGLVMTGIVVSIGLESVKIGLRHLVENDRKSVTVQWFHDEIYQGLKEVPDRD